MHLPRVGHTALWWPYCSVVAVMLCGGCTCPMVVVPPLWLSLLYLWCDCSVLAITLMLDQSPTSILSVPPFRAWSTILRMQCSCRGDVPTSSPYLYAPATNNHRFRGPPLCLLAPKPHGCWSISTASRTLWISEHISWPPKPHDRCSGLIRKPPLSPVSPTERPASPWATRCTRASWP